MHNKGYCHRDIKLENLLVDKNFNLKFIDFGFSASNDKKDIEKLNQYLGTKTYMAPEIKEGTTYSGKSTDIFSMAVVIFIIVKGGFPFLEAKRSDCYFKLIFEGKFK